MPWVRYDDQFPKHPKVLDVKAQDRAALALHLLCQTWSASSGTPGLVSDAAAIEEAGGKARAKRWAKVLCDAGLWHAPGHDCPRCLEITKGYVIHDFADWNPYEEIAAKRAEAGRKGAAARWRKGGKSDDKPMANAMAESSQSHGNSSGKKWPDPDPDPDPVVSGSVDQSSSPRYARGHGDDDQDPVLKTITDVLRDETGRTVPPEWADKVRRQILAGRSPDNPAAYVAACIRGAPRDYLPTSDEHPSSRSVAEAIAAARGDL